MENTVEQTIYSFILPVFNEEEVLPVLIDRLTELAKALDGKAEFIFVDDGSTDSSLRLILAARDHDPRIKALSFSRNFGHQIAITAGMDLAEGQAIVVMDADLQDSPEVVLKMVQKWRQGYEIVYAKRISREGETAFKKATATIFYRLLNIMTRVDIPLDTGDFRLIDRKALTTINQMRESDRFVRGMVAWLGFKQTAVEYHRSQRFAGATKYPLKNMVRLAIAAILGFSDLPIRLAVLFGGIISGCSFGYACFVIIKTLVTGRETSGWTSLITVTSFLGGLHLLVIGVIGLYIGRIYEEVKRRPLYVASKAVGFTRVHNNPQRAIIASWEEEKL
jgi:glycosyltransferase involved in cell wall biosynthesis